MRARGLALRIVVSCGVVFATLLFGSGLAWAAGVPGIGGESLVKAGSDGAVVGAQIDPEGFASSYYVEYGPSASYGSRSAEAFLGAGGESVAVTVRLTGLQPDVQYHFRFVASNEAGSTQGGDATFTSEGEEPSGLPDGRVYELASPFGNQFTEAYISQGIINRGSRFSSFPFEAASDGNAVTFVGSASGSGGSGNEATGGGGNQYRAARSLSGGWRVQNITPAGNLHSHYLGFSSDLTLGFVEAKTVVPIVRAEAPFNPENETNFFKRNLLFYSPLYERSFSEKELFPFSMASPQREVTERENEGEGAGGLWESFAGVSADSTHALFSSTEAPMEGGGTAEGELNTIFEKELSEEHEANIDEKEREEFNIEARQSEAEHGFGNPEAEELRAKEKEKLYAARALVAVGDRRELYVASGGRFDLVNVFSEGRVDPGALFGVTLDHVISDDGSRIFWQSTGEGPSPNAVFVREDGVRTVQVSAGAATFWTASNDGRYAFYTEASGLWRFDAESGARVQIAGGSGGMRGVIGTNETGEDGAYVYFVDTEKLTSEENTAKREAVEGEDNLYVYEPNGTGGSKIVFVATLPEEDGSDWVGALGSRTSNLTPDGHGLVFVANRNLTSSAYPGEGSEQVYVYDATDGSLFCASCRPQASGGTLSVSLDPTDVHRWISASGDQVFFESASPLVERDVDGRSDVYEWERDDTGTCHQAEGCVYLISNGVEGEANFLDASTSGADVFFTARQSLVPEVDGENVNVYDARIDGVLPVSAPECSGTGCQGVPAPAPVFATPASQTFEGVGNFPLLVSKPSVVGPRRLTRAQKLARALASCHENQRKKRRGCEAAARRSYGPKTAVKTRSARGGK